MGSDDWRMALMIGAIFTKFGLAPTTLTSFIYLPVNRSAMPRKPLLLDEFLCSTLLSPSPSPSP